MPDQTLQVTDRIELNVPLETLFRYYTNVQNVIKLAPPQVELRLVKSDYPLRDGARCLFATRPKMIPFEVQWLFKIESFKENESFCERLIKGPFLSWTHCHYFESLGPERSAVTDTLRFAPPKGIFRAIAPMELIKGKLEDAYRHRESVLRAALEGSPP